VSNATQVKFPTWSSANGQDDIVWYTDSNGAPWQVSIPQSSHPGGNINVHVYMDNASYTNVWCDGRNNIPLCVGRIQARAMIVTKPKTSCDDVRNSKTTLTGTVTHRFTPSSASQPAPKTQSGSLYTTFNNVISGSYTIDTQVPPEYQIAHYCWKTTNVPKSSGETQSAALPSADILTWDLGYTRGVAWSQVQGGDVYASATLQSFVPTGNQRVFIPDGAGGYPGIATYWQTYDFDSRSPQKGEDRVSSKNWLVKDTAPNTDFYQLMLRQFGGWPAVPDYTNATVTQPAARTAPYYVYGNMTTSGNWTIGNNQTLTFFVNGTLTIAGKINITGNGFAAFIVNGDIVVLPSVGETYNTVPQVPVVEGVYITSPGGWFYTGASGAGTERFVGKGMFIAGDFDLKRNVGDAGNTTTASELFIYNPQFLLTMPDAMKKLPVSWQEVAQAPRTLRTHPF
jgi:hypothetical protein